VMLKYCSLYFFTFLIVAFFNVFVTQAFAADISLHLNVEARGDSVRVQIRNTGKDPARILRLKVELDKIEYELQIEETLNNLSGPLRFVIPQELEHIL